MEDPDLDSLPPPMNPPLHAEGPKRKRKVRFLSQHALKLLEQMTGSKNSPEYWHQVMREMPHSFLMDHAPYRHGSKRSTLFDCE